MTSSGWREEEPTHEGVQTEMNGNRHQLNDNHCGYADYQHAPEEKDMNLPVFIIFFKETTGQKKHLLLG